MRKKLTVLILIFYLVNALAKSPHADDIKVNGKSVNIVKVKHEEDCSADQTTEPVCSEEEQTAVVPSESCSEEKSEETGNKI